MKPVNMHDAKSNLSRHLQELISKRNLPAAELRLLRKKPVREPRIGAARGRLVVAESFFEPLPDEILKAFLSKG